MYLALFGGFFSLYLGSDMLLNGYGRVGGAILFIGLVNLFNAWRIYRREASVSD